MNLSLIAIVLVGLVAALCGLVVANLKAQQRDVQAAWNRLDGLRRRGMEAVPAFVAAVSQDEATAQRAASSPSVVRRALDDVAAASRASASATGMRLTVVSGTCCAPAATASARALVWP